MPLSLLRVVLDADRRRTPVGYDPHDGEPYNSRERAFAAALGTAGRMAARRPPTARGDAAGVPDPPPAPTAHVVAGRGRSGAGAGRARADDHRDTLFADQTYLQQAQPSTVGHYLLSFAYPVLRATVDRLLDVIDWLNGSPAEPAASTAPGSRTDRTAMAARSASTTVIVNTRDAMWQVDGLVQLVSTRRQPRPDPGVARRGPGDLGQLGVRLRRPRRGVHPGERADAAEAQPVRGSR